MRAAAGEAQRAAEFETLARRELALVSDRLTATSDAARPAQDAQAGDAARVGRHGRLAPRPPGSPTHLAPRALRPTRYAVDERALTFVYHGCLIRLLGDRRQPRQVVTAVCYPEHAAGQQLVVFGEALAVSLAYYFRLLRGWARWGAYLVPAPPARNARAAAFQTNLIVNRMRDDMSFVIGRMPSAGRDRCNPLAGVVSSMLEAER